MTYGTADPRGTSQDLEQRDRIIELRPQPPAPPAPSAPSAHPSGRPAGAPAPASDAPPQRADAVTIEEPPAPQAPEPVRTLPPLEMAGVQLEIDDVLRYMIKVKASDLHVKPGAPPMLRVGGLLVEVPHPPLSADQCHSLSTAMMGDDERATLAEWGESDFAYSVSGLGRFRVNVHRQRGSYASAVRYVLPTVPTFEQLMLPDAVRQLAGVHRGLVLVTGPTSSGKTTTCGAIISHINRTRRCHIVTIEDPIEILHRDEQAIVTQREVGQDTKSFGRALRAAMRQDPDVIFVGEIRDLDTAEAALQAAETGHLVVATLHTKDVVETINRVVDFFPTHQHKQVRVTLAGSLAGVITQRLLPRVGGGRAAAIEIMIMNGRIRDCILDGDRAHEIHDIVAESGFYGMQTFDQALVKLYSEGLVSLEDAKSAANSPHDFELALRKEGVLER